VYCTHIDGALSVWTRRPGELVFKLGAATKLAPPPPRGIMSGVQVRRWAVALFLGCACVCVLYVCVWMLCVCVCVCVRVFCEVRIVDDLVVGRELELGLRGRGFGFEQQDGEHGYLSRARTAPPSCPSSTPQSHPCAGVRGRSLLRAVARRAARGWGARRCSRGGGKVGGGLGLGGERAGCHEGTVSLAWALVGIHPATQPQSN